MVERTCRKCAETFSTRSNARRHERSCRKDPFGELEPFLFTSFFADFHLVPRKDESGWALKTKSQALELKGHEWRSLRNSKAWCEETLAALKMLEVDLVEPWGLSKKMLAQKTVQEEVLPSLNVLLHLALVGRNQADVRGWNLLRRAFSSPNITSYTIIVGLLKSELTLFEISFKFELIHTAHLFIHFPCFRG